MILYLDASALVKRYVAEPGSDAVEREIAKAEAVGTTIASRVEVVAAFAKSVRFGTLTDEDADAARRRFHSEWRRVAAAPSIGKSSPSSRIRSWVASCIESCVLRGD